MRSLHLRYVDATLKALSGLDTPTYEQMPGNIIS